MKLRSCFHLIALLGLSTLIHQPSTTLAQGTAFTYQGQLNDGANPANGSYDLQFGLWSAASGPAQLGSTLTSAATPVSNGQFTVTLDFGNQFPGADRWLEIAVRTNGGGAYSTLLPRQALTPTPYAIYSANAGSATTATTADSANSVAATNITGMISSNNLGAASIADTKLATIGTPGKVTDSALSANVALLNRSGQTFTGGTNSFAGNAGIGTASPGARLHLYGSENPTVMRLQSSGGFGSGKVEFWSDPQGAANEWRPASIRSVDNGGFTGGLSFLVNGSGSANKTNEVEAMRIVNGNVGIGTNAPSTKLEVAGTVKATAFAGSGSGLTGINASEMTSGAVPDARLSANVSLLGSSIESGEITDGTIGNADVSPTAAIADTKLATIFTPGKVLDSALSPNVALRGTSNLFNGHQIISNGNVTIRRDGTATVGPTLTLLNSGSLSFGNAVAIDLNANTSAVPATAQILAVDEGGFSAGIRLSTKNPGNATNPLVERVRITSAGNIGIGTTNPAFPLTLSGTGDKVSFYSEPSGIGIGFGLQNGLFQIHADRSTTDIAFGYGSSASMTPTMRIQGTGTVKFGSSAQYFAPAAEENVRIVRGVIQNNAVTASSTTGFLVPGPGQSMPAATVQGPGYGVTRIAAGRYIVAFTPPFTTVPAITANAANVAPNDALTYFCDIGDLTVNSCEVRLGISGSGNYDLGFTFIAIGPR